MSKLLHLNQKKENCQSETLVFMQHVKKGLSTKHKRLASKYFYDARGSQLFNNITRHPDYYLTLCELEILTRYKKEIANTITPKPFNLIELGPGEGIKTLVLLEQFLKDHLEFSYVPIDISNQFLQTMEIELRKKCPAIDMLSIHSDYFHGLEWLKKYSNRQNVVLFLGSSIGNFNPTEMIIFLRHLRSSLNTGDLLLIGFDLRKEIDILMRAYNDTSGLTREFNLNLLLRINRELRGHFAVEKFRHYATYNVHSGAMESYLVSVEAQRVMIDSLKQAFSFDPIEPIHVEYSYKYLLSELNDFASQTGFEVVNHYQDSKKYFVDALWCAKKEDGREDI